MATKQIIDFKDPSWIGKFLNGGWIRLRGGGQEILNQLVRNFVIGIIPKKNVMEWSAPSGIGFNEPEWMFH